MKKACNFCGNRNFSEKNVQYIYKRDDRFLIVNHVPCEECDYCGEQYFKSEVLTKIESIFNDIYNSGRKAKRKISLPVEEFAEI